MAEQDRPAVADPLVEPDRSLGGVGLEVGRGVVDAQAHVSSPHMPGGWSGPTPEPGAKLYRNHGPVILARTQAMPQSETDNATYRRRPQDAAHVCLRLLPPRIRVVRPDWRPGRLGRLGGGEFRLPVLMHSVGFSAKIGDSDQSCRQRLVTWHSRLATRSRAVSLADVLPHGPKSSGWCRRHGRRLLRPAAGQASGERAAGPNHRRSAGRASVRCSWPRPCFPSRIRPRSREPDRPLCPRLLRSAADWPGCSLLGVAGGELLIPTLIFVFGADIVTAGSASILISLCLISVGLWRYLAARRLSARAGRPSDHRAMASDRSLGPGSGAWRWDL